MELGKIKNVLYKKINSWIKTFDLDLCEKHNINIDELSRSILISGGAIPSLILNETPNDFDVYIYGDNSEVLIQKLIDYYTDYKSILCVTLEEPSIFNIDEPDDDTEKVSVLSISKNSITLDNKIQIITRFTGKTPNDIISNFDYKHVTGYYIFNERKIYITYDIMDCIINKRLTYVGSKFPLASIIRSKKFINRGWKLNSAEYIKMALQLTEIISKSSYIEVQNSLNSGDIINLKDVEMHVEADSLIDQISGVYTTMTTEISRSIPVGNYQTFDELNDNVDKYLERRR